MTNYRFNLDYNSSNELVSSTFTETSSPTPSVTLTRDALMNTRITVFAPSYADAVAAANKAMGTPEPAPAQSAPTRGFVEQQIEARRMCREILADAALLGDNAKVNIPIGLLRFLVDALDIAGEESRDA